MKFSLRSFRSHLLLLMALVTIAPAVSGQAAVCPPNIFPGVNPANLADPQAGLTNLYTFNNPILDATKLQKYVTVVPNALTPGFIYTPNGTQNGETLYTVSMREISQSLGVVYNNPLNTADPNNGCTGPLNTLWAYGDARDNGVVNTAPTAGHSVPGPTFELTSKSAHRVLWTNELPNTNPYYHPSGAIDPTLDCGPNAPGCAPFNRVVPHVHGAHVADDSDGNPDQWFTPNFLKTGHNWQPNTHIPGAVTGTYRYENTQEAATVWYHDHAMGLTHLNVFAGLAGFNIIRDANEIAMQTPVGTALATLPKYPYENLLAIQDRAFDANGKLYAPDRPVQNQNATLTGVACDPLQLTTVTAANPVISPYACVAANLVAGIGTTLLATTPCDPAASIVAPISPYACPIQYFTRNADGSLIKIPTGTVPPAGALTFPSITSEYWGNVILVNGQVWPKQDVEKRVYRFRWLNGSDSRTYILRLVDKTTKAPIVGLDVYQIGTEQGFLNAPVKVMVNDPTVNPLPIVGPFPQTNAIVVMPGERVDVLVDFTNVALNTQVILQNLGPDFPYTGEYPDALNLNGQLPTPIVPEVMLLNVVAASAAPNTLAPTAITSLRPALVPLTTTVGTPVRTLYLAERVDQFGRLALTINGVDYMTAIDQFIKLGDTEEWDVVNLTPDGHPMHPHLVAFQLINRQDLIDPATNLPFAPPMNLPLLGTTISAQFTGVVPNPAMPTATGAIYPPAPNELNAWKDTIFMPPGKVTRIKATFDIPGLYVFHCHILSHEENDMMRPFAVTTPAASVTLTASPATQYSGATSLVTLTAAAKTGIAAHTDSNAFEYQFTVTSPAGVVTALSQTAMVPSSVLNSVYSMIRTATWTPPTVPGTYVITVNAKAMGAALAVLPVTTTLNYVIAAPAIAGATSTTGTGFYKAGTNVNVSVAFNQAITSTGLAITLNNGVILNTGALANVSSFSGSFIVAAGQDTPAGQFLNITGITGTITDAANNAVVNPTVPAGFNIANSVQIVIDTVAPTSSAMPPAGTYGSSVSVTLKPSEAATIYYTTDGTTPTVGGLTTTIYTAPILLSSPTTATVTLKFFAVDKALNVEAAINTAIYNLHTADLVAKVAINNGKLWTNSVSATLAMSASDPAGISAYAISYDNITYLPTVAINPTVKVFSGNAAITLPTGDGLKTVYVKFTDGLGVVYPPVSAQINLETALPVVNVTPAGGDYAGKITVSLSSPNEPEGATIYYTINGSTPSPSAKGTKIYSTPFIISGAGKTVTVKFYAADLAGNVGTVQSVAYRFVSNPDMTEDSNINNGAPYTNSRDVMLKVSAQDPIGGGVDTMSFSNDGVNFTTPVPYVKTDAMPWTLTSGDALKTVYFRFTDVGTTGVAPITYTFTDTIFLAEGVTLANGDVNGDGKVDVSDVFMAYLASAGLKKLTIAQQARGDVAPLVYGKPMPDGKITSGDVLVIARKVLGLVSF